MGSLRGHTSTELTSLPDVPPPVLRVLAQETIAVRMLTSGSLLGNLTEITRKSLP